MSWESHKELFIKTYKEQMNKPLSGIDEGSKVLMLGMGAMLIPRYVLKGVEFTVIENNTAVVEENITHMAGHRLVSKDAKQNPFKREKFDAIIIDCFSGNFTKNTLDYFIEEYRNVVEDIDNNHYYIKTLLYGKTVD